MRTTLDLPIDLLNEAMKATHIKTKTKVIIIALEEVIRKSNIAELKEFKGRVDWDIDLRNVDEITSPTHILKTKIKKHETGCLE